MKNQNNPKTGILDLLGISPRMRKHMSPRTPLRRMYCGKVELVRPRLTLDDLNAMETADRRYREMTDIYEAEMAVAQVAPAS